MKKLISILLSVAAIALFVVLYGLEIIKAWQKLSSPGDPINTPSAYIATAVAGLVVAIIATALGVPVPDPPPARESRTRRMVKRLGDAVAGTREPADWKRLLTAAFIVGYMVIGFAAIITWAVKSEYASSLIKTQALTWLGLMLAVVRSFLSDPQPSALSSIAEDREAHSRVREAVRR